MKAKRGTTGRNVMCMAVLLCAVLLYPFRMESQEQKRANANAQEQKAEKAEIPTKQGKPGGKEVPMHRRGRTQVPDEDGRTKKKDKKDEQPLNEVQVVDISGDTIAISAPDSIVNILDAEVLARKETMRKDSVELAEYGKVKIFNPDANRAMWLSVLFPGLGQVYNRRYWKLPIIVGGFVGLGYATTWNSRMLSDYTKAYRDAMDNDPGTKSYMDFYPPTVSESDIDMSWLKRTLKSKKDYFRRNRDLCIISMVGLYLLCAVDAYVDASLAHFDISEDLSVNFKPAVMEPATTYKLPSVGVQCALNF